MILILKSRGTVLFQHAICKDEAEKLHNRFHKEGLQVKHSVIAAGKKLVSYTESVDSFLIEEKRNGRRRNSCKNR